MVSYKPENLREALRLRAHTGAIPCAGGTDLMIEGAKNTSYLFLHDVPELRGIRQDGDILRIGAACTFAEVAASPLCPAILREAILQIAAPAIRNIGTVGGNIGNGSPKADSALIFFVTDSELRLVSEKGERLLPVKDFYLGRKELALASDELIAEVQMPLAGLARYYYRKVGARDALAISRLSFAGIIEQEGGVITRLATAFGAVSDVIIRRADIDAMLVGKTPAQAKDTREAYLAAFDKAIVPIRGRVSAAYRKRVCMNLLQDFLDTAGI